jgi:solute carrier family 15 (peptide/histidine transporter), member 3/4
VDIYTSATLLSAMHDRRSIFKQNASFVILLTVNTLERFAFYGLASNFVLYLNKQPLHWCSFNATQMLLLMMGISYSTGVIGGWISDSFLGKFRTICVSYCIYIIGYGAYPLLAYYQNSVPGFCSMTHPNVTANDGTSSNSSSHLKESSSDADIGEEPCAWVIITSSILIGIGVGFIKATLGPFGADQVQKIVFKFNKLNNSNLFMIIDV